LLVDVDIALLVERAGPVPVADTQLPARNGCQGRHGRVVRRSCDGGRTPGRGTAAVVC
jgi:hypothetical protein